MSSNESERDRVELLLDRLEESILSLQGSVRQSVMDRNYLEADEKQRELIRLKQFYQEKQAELTRLETRAMESSAKDKLGSKLEAIERIFRRKIEILDNHVALVNTELKRKHGDEFLCRQQEFELVKPHLVHNNPDTAALRRGEYNAAKSGQYTTANRYRSVLDNEQMKVIPKEEVNDLWRKERAKLMKKQENERKEVDDRRNKIESIEKNTMIKHLALTKEKYKMHRFDHFYKGESGIRFDEDEFLRYINRGPLRLRHHNPKLPYYQELSRSIDSSSKKSHRDSSIDRSTDRSRFNYDHYDSYTSCSPKKGSRETISVNTLSDSKASNQSKLRTTYSKNRYNGGVSLIDWTDAVFVVPKGSKPRYLKKHVYDVDPSPIFDPNSSNRPRESSREKADKVIRYWDEACGKSSRGSSRSKSRPKVVKNNPTQEFVLSTNKKSEGNSNSGKSGTSRKSSTGADPARNNASNQKSLPKAKGDSEIDIDFEDDEEGLDPNQADLPLAPTEPGNSPLNPGKSTAEDSRQTSEPLASPKLEPAFETKELFEALSTFVIQMKVEDSASLEPEFEERAVFSALAKFVSEIEVMNVEPEFEERVIFGALAKFVSEIEVLNVESEFEERVIFGALAKFVTEIEVKNVEPEFEERVVFGALARFVTEIQVKTVEPAFETRELFKALTSIAKPQNSGKTIPDDVPQLTPKTEPEFESRTVLRAFGGLAGLKPKVATDNHAYSNDQTDSPVVIMGSIKKHEVKLNPSSAQ